MTDDVIEHAAEPDTTPETDIGAATDTAAETAADRAPDRRAADDAFETMRQVDAAGAARLRQEWGEAFDANLKRARNAAAMIADDALVAVLEETGLGNDPRILRAAARIGTLLERQATAHKGPPAAQRESLERELDRLVGGPDYWSDRVQDRVRQIFVSLHGESPLPVHRAAGDAGGKR